MIFYLVVSVMGVVLDYFLFRTVRLNVLELSHAHPPFAFSLHFVVGSHRRFADARIHSLWFVTVIQLNIKSQPTKNKRGTRRTNEKNERKKERNCPIIFRHIQVENSSISHLFLIYLYDFSMTQICMIIRSMICVLVFAGCSAQARFDVRLSVHACVRACVCRLSCRYFYLVQKSVFSFAVIFNWNFSISRCHGNSMTSNTIFIISDIGLFEPFREYHEPFFFVTYFYFCLFLRLSVFLYFFAFSFDCCRRDISQRLLCMCSVLFQQQNNICTLHRRFIFMVIITHRAKCEKLMNLF